MKKSEVKIYNIAISAVFTAVIAVISQFSVMMPFGVPLSFQTLAVALAGYALGAKLSVAAVAVYILLGAVGLPIFSGFLGGIQHLAGATGGFLIGFLFLSLFCGFSKPDSNIRIRFFYGAIGLILCHFIGALQFALVSGIGISEAFLSSSLPFIIKDLILVFLACVFSKRIKEIIVRIK